ncbi:DMT family transporter [Shimazuella sp. AN120528]|uniref:DMT family transporter n=1 Tax=Shimazuella soli TaxID=1892854 RepID=UPI001F113B4F|nr:DMT family transporter [Shimazuella soli]MCH5584563.1 DMT family transporter [Shimazuella soli]
MRTGIKMAYAAAITYSILIGLSFMFVKLIVHTASAFDILAVRFLLSLVMLTIPILFGWIKLQIKLKDIFRLIPLAVLYPIFFFTFQTWGLLGATSAEGGIIQATAPIFTAVLAAFVLNEKTNLWQKLFLILSVGGVIFIFVMQGSAISIGHLGSIGFLLLSTFSFAVYTILVRRIGQTYKSYDLSYVIIMLASISFIIISMVEHVLSGTMDEIVKPFYQPIYLYSIFYLAAFSSVSSILLSNYALSKLEAYKVSVFNNLSTLVSILAGVVFLNEPITSVHVIGAFMIIVGVVGTNLAGQWSRRSELTIKNEKGDSYE